ncbi:MAG: glycosyltransferase family 4 protein [Egibacteraceae bacterium]
MTPPRVALVCPYDWSRPGGVRHHVAHLADHLRATHEVAVFAPASEPVAEAHVHPVGGAVGVRYNRSVAPVALAPTAARRLTGALRAFAPDLVHVHEPFAPLLGLAATARAPHPVIGTFHAWSHRDRAYRAAAPVASRLARRLDARIAVSPAAQQYAAKALGLPHAAFTVLPNGVDAEAFARAEPLRELIDPERPLLLFVGRLEPRKGLDVAVRAFLRLRASDASVRLCVVGDGPERDRCQQMVPPSLRPDVLFVGRVDADDLPRYHASADLLVAPATGGESFGIVLLEAMAAGLPVVASDIPGYRTVLHDGRQGRLVPPRDAFALADAAGTLLASPRLRDAMAEQGRRTAAEYAWPVVGARIAALYETVRARAASP